MRDLDDVAGGATHTAPGARTEQDRDQHRDQDQDRDRDAGQAWAAAMRCGDFAAGWALNDAALAARDPATRDDPALPYHQRWVWDGTAPDDRDVLVRCYHGLGDTLQFSRYLPLLAARARHLTVEVQPALAGLLAELPAGPDGGWALVPFRPEAPLPPAPCTMEIMEAGHALRVLPPPAFAPGRPRRAAGALRVGVCGAGGDWDRLRSVPPGVLDALAELRGVAWTCLQPGEAKVGWASDGMAGRFGPMLPPGGTVADTARLVRGLDLVVTVDTMVAHLAGTLGVPCWVMLRAEPDWRWLPDIRRSPWYPSVRLFRQAAPGDWAGVVRAVRRELALVQTAGPGEFAPAFEPPGDIAET